MGFVIPVDRQGVPSGTSRSLRSSPCPTLLSDRRLSLTLALHRARSAIRSKSSLRVVRGSRKARRKACGDGGRKRHRLGVLLSSLTVGQGLAATGVPDSARPARPTPHSMPESGPSADLTTFWDGPAGRPPQHLHPGLLRRMMLSCGGVWSSPVFLQRAWLLLCSSPPRRGRPILAAPRHQRRGSTLTSLPGHTTSSSSRVRPATVTSAAAASLRSCRR